VYSLSDSINAGWAPICCTAGETKAASFAHTYRAAYFGGMRFHEAPAVVTVAFLVVLLLLSAAQVSACHKNPNGWVIRGAGAALGCLITVHLLLFVGSAPLCRGWGVFEWMLLVTGAFAFLGILDLGMVWADLRDDTSTWGRRLDQFVGLFVECMLLIATSALDNALAGVIGSGASTTMIVMLGIPVVSLLILVVRESVWLYTNGEQDTIVPAAAKAAAKARFAPYNPHHRLSAELILPHAGIAFHHHSPPGRQWDGELQAPQAGGKKVW
jgi:hypothetical protein